MRKQPETVLCGYCERNVPAGAGLAAHIRNAHKGKPYKVGIPSESGVAKIFGKLADDDPVPEAAAPVASVEDLTLPDVPLAAVTELTDTNRDIIRDLIHDAIKTKLNLGRYRDLPPFAALLLKFEH